jgi:hypothetical protein
LTSSYAELWQKFLCFCYRVVGDEEAYGVGFLYEQKEILLSLKRDLEAENIQDDILDEQVLCLKNITDYRYKNCL